LLFGIEKNFIAELQFLNPRAFKVMRPDSCRLALRNPAVVWHSPSNAHAYRL
jgi:hypothetical protein